MKKTISKALLRLSGWKLGPVVGDVPKCVICVAPHTSNWDFIVGKLFYTSIGRNASFLIKKEWFFFPFNLLFDWLGGVPVDQADLGDGPDGGLVQPAERISVGCDS